MAIEGEGIIWPYYPLQKHEYERVFPTTYQLGKPGLCLEYKQPDGAKQDLNLGSSRVPELLSFVISSGLQNSKQFFSGFIMGPESPGSQTFVEDHSVLGRSSCLASSVNIHLTARAFIELAESKNIRTTEGAFCTEQLKMQSSLGLESSDDSPGVLSFRIFIMKSTMLKGMPTLDILTTDAHMGHDLRHCVTTCYGLSAFQLHSLQTSRRTAPTKAAQPSRRPHKPPQPRACFQIPHSLTTHPSCILPHTRI